LTSYSLRSQAFLVCVPGDYHQILHSHGQDEGKLCEPYPS
jgi:hypothetical protein